MPVQTPITLEEFRSLMPQFASTPDAQVQAQINASAASFSLAHWGDLYLTGASNWVAHQLQLSADLTADPSLAGGDAVVREQAGDVSYQKDAGILGKQMANPFMRTYYGQQYLYYRRLVGLGTVLVV